MSWSVRIKGSASKELADIPQPARSRLARAIDGLAEQPLAGSPLKGELQGLRRLRVGNYRIVYELLEDEDALLVLRVAHRQEAY